jgi:hypothetical protein
MFVWIQPDGAVRFLYEDAWRGLLALGAPTIRRASHVEPTPDGHWTADLGLMGGPRLGPLRKRWMPSTPGSSTTSTRAFRQRRSPVRSESPTVIPAPLQDRAEGRRALTIHAHLTALLASWPRPSWRKRTPRRAISAPGRARGVQLRHDLPSAGPCTWRRPCVLASRGFASRPAETHPAGTLRRRLSPPGVTWRRRAPMSARASISDRRSAVRDRRRSISGRRRRRRPHLSRSSGLTQSLTVVLDGGDAQGPGGSIPGAAERRRTPRQVRLERRRLRAPGVGR